MGAHRSVRCGHGLPGQTCPSTTRSEDLPSMTHKLLDRHPADCVCATRAAVAVDTASHPRRIEHTEHSRGRVCHLDGNSCKRTAYPGACRVRLGLPRVTAASRTTSSTVEDCGHGAQPSTAPADARNTAAALARGAACCVPRNRRGRTPPMGDGREGLVPILVSAPPSASHRNCRSAAPDTLACTRVFCMFFSTYILFSFRMGVPPCIPSPAGLLRR